MVVRSRPFRVVPDRSCSSDRSISAFDIVKEVSNWSIKDSHTCAVNCIRSVGIEGSEILASGDDDGYLKLWDLRSRKSAWSPSKKICEDFISDICVDEKRPHRIIVSSGDGTLSVVDCRKNKIVCRSDDQEDDLLSVAVVKSGTKIVVGTESGVLLIFSHDQWRDQSDRFPGHPHSISTIVKVDNDTIMTGSGDGMIRLVSVQPNALLGLIGDHGTLPIERLRLSSNKRTLASSSYDHSVKIWDIGYFWDDDDDVNVDDKEDETVHTRNTTSTQANSKRGSKRDIESSTAEFPADESMKKKKKKKIRHSQFDAKSMKKKSTTKKDVQDFFSGL